MTRQPGRPKAVVLVVVVYIVAALSMFAFGLAFRTKIAIKQANLLIERLQQDQLALAVCTQAKGILAADNDNVDCFDEPWSGWRKLEPAETTGQSSDRDDSLWQVHWKLTDESAKINVNLASAELLSGLKCLDEATVASIVDWIDQDDIPNPDGAENDYYSSLDSAYNCKNGPIDNIEELLLIKGISPQIYYDSNPDEETSHWAEMDIDLAESVEPDSQNGSVGLCDLLTVYGDGRININTASKQVLGVIPMLSDAAISEIISRQKSVTWKFSSMEDIQNNDNFTGADKLSLIQIAKFNSNHFQLIIRVRKKTAHFWCEYVATIERQGGNTQLLSWQRNPRAVLKDITHFAANSDQSVHSKDLKQ